MQQVNSILKVLAYFDLFNYPITKKEIKLFLDCRLDDGQLESLLQQLSYNKLVYRFGQLYSLQNNPLLIQRRENGNIKAGTLLRKANRIAGFLFKFPYVRGIGISGSLSKNFAEEKTDIDYFVITKSNRLWIARTLMHLFKKLTFLTRSQHWYCMNYYVDEAALQIPEKNIFTATEIVTLMPVYGNGTLTSFFEANKWVQFYLPNYPLASLNQNKLKDSLFKKLIESIFDNRVGDKLDNYLMKLTTKRWTKKEENHILNIKGNRMGLKTGKHFSKPNPDFFQQKILIQFQSRLSQLEAKWKLVSESLNSSFAEK